ncbi:MAG TPA: ATP-binding protein [Patescibacteria group bacterium]|nr:ATP-binding protein [Patescibacteria group bacterium]
MFEHARIRLTIWYLAIIMTVSIMFSIGIYNATTREIQRVMRLQTLRTLAPDEPDFLIPRNPTFRPRNLEDLLESEERIRLTLVLINASIFIIAGGAAYFLAGITLKPIKQMVENQNRFISDASHEMRTPLTSLRSEIEVELRNKEITPARAREILASNLEEVVSLQTLSDNLLELSQFENPQNTVFTLVSIRDSVDTAIKKLNGSAAKKKIKIEQKIEDTTVKGVSERITQLFIILLDNAIKYSPENSKVLVSAKRRENRVRIEVKDTGTGIAQEDLPHIFDRFYRATKSRSKEKASGYGLGLSIAREIIASHNGTISVKSEVGKYTSFIIKLPA